MRACINFFIANKDSNIKQILGLKFEGNKPSTSGDADSVPYYHASMMDCTAPKMLCPPTARPNSPKHPITPFAAKKPHPLQCRS